MRGVVERNAPRRRSAACGCVAALPTLGRSIDPLALAPAVVESTGAPSAGLTALPARPTYMPRPPIWCSDWRRMRRLRSCLPPRPPLKPRRRPMIRYEAASTDVPCLPPAPCSCTGRASKPAMRFLRPCSHARAVQPRRARARMAGQRRGQLRAPPLASRFAPTLARSSRLLSTSSLPCYPRRLEAWAWQAPAP